MGWTYTDLARNRMTLEQVKQNHVREATRYGEATLARMIMHEWHPKTWYAIIGLYPPLDPDPFAPELFDQLAKTLGTAYMKPTKIFLRTDIIDIAGGQFGYKDMCEDMGPRLDDKPSRALAKAVFKYIPEPCCQYAREFRDWAGIPYLRARSSAGR